MFKKKEMLVAFYNNNNNKRCLHKFPSKHKYTVKNYIFKITFVKKPEASSMTFFKNGFEIIKYSCFFFSRNLVL
jgi:hypothetical protein